MKITKKQWKIIIAGAVILYIINRKQNGMAAYLSRNRLSANSPILPYLSPMPGRYNPKYSYANL